ncbi:MAG: NAD-dependent epimerase/dehydratase family protein, partial [Gemmataceae bacterium]
LRGQVVTLETFRQTLAEVLPESAGRVTIGTSQIAIMYDLADDGLQRDLGPMPRTTLADGIADTVRIFRDRLTAGQLDASELDHAQAPPVTDEP